MEATSDEEILVVLDSDFLTFNMYNLKKQERFKNTEYKNEQRKIVLTQLMSQKYSPSPSPLTTITSWLLGIIKPRSAKISGEKRRLS